MEHIAVEPQGLSFVQGLIQFRFRHAWVGEHSKSEEQPIGSGSTNEGKFEKFNFKKIPNLTFKIKIILGKKVFLTDSITSVITLSGETWQTFTAHSSKWQ